MVLKHAVCDCAFRNVCLDECRMVHSSKSEFSGPIVAGPKRVKGSIYW